MSPISNSLQHQFLGFLATPPLWKDSGPINIPQYLTYPIPWSPEFQQELLVPDKLILGKRVEYFFAFFVKQHASEVLVAQNLVISHGKRTMGEIDFLLLNKEKQEFTHVELVYKFYLFDPERGGDLGPWIGPNRKDSLLRKLHRLEEHQFPLLYREEFREVAQNLNLPLDQILQKLCFKANLFVPPDMLNQKFSGINNDCIQGFWIRIQDFQEKAYGAYYYHTPKKQFWTMDPQYCEDWYDFAEIEEQLCPLLQAKRSPLLWMKTADKEYQRFFIVWW